ncbi:MAG: hypothetical protein DMF55_09550 [Acidobacteria bacterium]|nr:MAG: hypothetical protein DMF55_09550 [Acidobacteriota bacterium]
MIFPSISSVGRTDAMTSSTMRFVFSSMTPRNDRGDDPAAFLLGGAFGGDLESLQVDALLELLAERGGQPLLADLLAEQHRVDRALHLLERDELGHGNRVVLGPVLLQQRRIQNEIAVELLVQDLLAEEVLRPVEVSGDRPRLQDPVDSPASGSLLAARLFALGELAREWLGEMSGQIDDRDLPLAAGLTDARELHGHVAEKERRHEKRRDPERLGADALQVLAADDGKDFFPVHAFLTRSCGSLPCLPP